MAEVAQPETAAEVEDDAKTSETLGGGSPWATIAKLARVVAEQERRAARTRRLALAALRLAILAAATHRVRWIGEAFSVAVKWAGGEPNEEAAPFINAAIDEALAALREAGEVSE